MKEFLLKSIHQVESLLPGPTVYFIYTHNNLFDRFKYGLKANTEISYFILAAIKKKFRKVKFLRIEKEKEVVIRKISSRDVVVGHIGETYLRASEKTKHLIAFHPWAGHEDRSENQLFNCMPKDKELNYWDKAASLVLLTSEFNVREYVNKPTNFWHRFFKESKKRIRFVHQPIDLTYFPRVKYSYTTNDFLYVGNNAHMKCLDDSKTLVAKVGRKLHLYGVDENRLDNLNKAQHLALATKSDFFIQPGMWEAQCVSILEAAARGFIPVVSKETGYPYEHPFLLRHGDLAYNEKILTKLLNTPKEERKELADSLHKQLVNDHNHNTWKKLTDVLVEEVKFLLC